MDVFRQSTSQMQCRTVVIDDSESDADSSDGATQCLVCGEPAAAMHYGAMACVGCKGFFRRALMKADQLECQINGDCLINKDLRTNCRSCRFRKCLAIGMQPSAVRPNRDYSSRQKKKALALPDESVNCNVIPSKTKDDYMKKMSVEMRTMLMNLLNIEAKIMKGDTSKPVSQLYPLKIAKLQQLLDDPTVLNGKRSQMRYEPYRIAKNDELSSVAYRRLIAAIDWVESLCELIGGVSRKDKIALVKSSFAPLMVFKCASRTAEVTKDNDILCLCNFAYVPRNISQAFSDSYHLGNGLVGRALDELVSPYREYGMREEEIVCVSAMIALNPLCRDLSTEAFDKIVDFRNKVQDTLFTIVKEARHSPHPSICFGHIILSLPTVQELANTMCENLQFAQTFSAQGEIPLLTDLFGCFPVEPFSDDETSALDQMVISTNPAVRASYEKGTQTDQSSLRTRKRAHEVDDHSPRDFRLLQPPGNFTLTEMFDDIAREVEAEEHLAPPTMPGPSHSQPDLLRPLTSQKKTCSWQHVPVSRTQSTPFYSQQPQHTHNIQTNGPPLQPSQDQVNNRQYNPAQWNGYY